MELIDTHAHIFMEHFDDDREQVIENALKTGVKKIYNPNVDLKTIDRLLKTEEAFPGVCLPLMGLHPGSVRKDFEKVLFEIETVLNSHKFYGIGEVGLDFYYTREFQDEQIEAFRIQVQWAKKMNLPVIIHTRKAFNEIFEVLNKENDDSLKGIFHCFTGNIRQAEKIISYGGFKLGIGGVVTFKNSKLGDTLKNIDLKHIVLETDSPFLTPHPYRGKRNEPAYVSFVAQKLAEIYNVSVEKIAEITTKNAIEIFGEN